MSYERFATWRDNPESLRPFLSIIIPAYNEAGRLVPTIASIVSYLTEAGYSFEVIVSDDGSTDDTPDLCRRLRLPNLRVIGDGVNRGKGAAVRRGVEAATGAWILFTDADLSTPIEEIDSLLVETTRADVVIGSRAAEGADEGDKSLVRRALSAASRRTVRGLLGLNIADTQCGFKLFSAEAARKLFAVQRVDGFGFDAELLYLAQDMGYSIVEVPVRWIDAPGSTVDPMRVPVSFVRDLLRVRLFAARGSYRSRPSGRGPLRLGVVTALPPSKASLTEYGEHLVASLEAADEIEELVVFADDSNGIAQRDGDVDVVPAWTFDSLVTPLRLALATRRHKPNVVLFNLHFTSFGTRKVACALGLVTPLLLRLLGTPTVVLTHNLVDTTDLEAAGYSSHPLQQRVFTAIGRALTRVLLGANHVVTTMPDYVDVLRTKYGATHVSLTPHGAFECPDFAPDQADGGPRQLLAFGKFGTYKRVETLIDAYRDLVQQPEFCDVELVIAGTDSPAAPGYLASVQQTCRDLPGVRFTGYVAEEDVATVFGDAHIVVFPYTGTTGSSGPLHQAGSYSRPVVAPRLGDFIDLIEEEGYAAEPFEPGNAASLANALGSLLGDPDRRRSMGQQNHAAATGLSLADVAEWHVAHLVNVAAAH